MIPGVPAATLAGGMLAGAVSYLVAGVLYLGFTALLVTGGGGTRVSRWLVGACGMTAIWAIVLALHAYTQSLPALVLFAAELARYGIWLSFLAGIVLAGRSARSRLLAWTVAGLPVAMLIFAAMLNVGNRLISPLGEPATILFLGPLLLAVIGLVLTEQIFRNTKGLARWAIKFLCFGLGGMFAYDIFLYSHGVLYKQVNTEFWSARGVILALTVPLIAISVRRKTDWSLDIFVSRHAAFYSATLFAAALYLIVVALGGYYIRLLGQTWADFARAVFFFCAALGLVIVLFSSQVRAEIRVFLAKHFYRNKYEYRDEWLRLIATLDAEAAESDLVQRSARALAQIVGGPCATVWLRAENGLYEPVAAFDCALSSREHHVSPESRLVEVLRDRDWIIDVDQSRAAGREDRLDIPLSIAPAGRNHLIIPLKQGPELIGFAVVETPVQNFDLTFEDIDLLRTVGRQIASYLSLQATMQRLAESRQFEAYNRLSSFLMHDLKNIVSQQSLVVQNAARHKADPKFIDDAIETIDLSVTRMRKLLNQMGNKAPPGSLTCPSLADIVRSAAAGQSTRSPSPRLDVRAEPVRVLVDESRCQSVIEHLIRNAQDATPDDGEVHVTLDVKDGMAVLEVRDTGSGMDEEFIARKLFQPFYTTKGAQGMGIGAYQAREFAREAGGSLVVESVAGQGSRFTLSLPVNRNSAGGH